MAGVIVDDDDNIEYDEDGNAIIPDKKVFTCCQHRVVMSPLIVSE